MALNLMKIPHIWIPPAGSFDYSIGDNLLDNVSSGFYDVTVPSYVPRQDRLDRLDVISVSVSPEACHVIAANAALVHRVEEFRIDEIFERSIWAMILIWRVVTAVVFPTAKRRRVGVFAVFAAVLLLSEVFGFFVEKIFMESFVYSRVDQDEFPFRSLEQLFDFVSRDKAKLLTVGFVPGIVKPLATLMKNVEVLQASNEVLAAVNDDKNYVALFGIGKFTRLSNENKFNRKNIHYNLVHPTDEYGLVSFCSKSYLYKREVALGLLTINEAGLTYARRHRKVIRLVEWLDGGSSGLPKPVVIQEVGRCFVYYLTIQAACAFMAVLEWGLSSLVGILIILVHKP